jgi:EamA-like transporter family
MRLDAGGAFIAAACLAWGIDNNLTRKLSSADPVMIALIKGLAAGAVNFGLGLARHAAVPPAGAMAAATLVGFFGIGVSLVLFVLALRHLGSARTGAYFSLAPFIGAVVALVVLHDPLTAQLAIAGLLMGVGLWLHFAERHEHEHMHAVTEHVHVHDEHHRHRHDGPVSEPHSHWRRHFLHPFLGERRCGEAGDRDARGARQDESVTLNLGGFPLLRLGMFCPGTHETASSALLPATGWAFSYSRKRDVLKTDEAGVVIDWTHVAPTLLATFLASLVEFVEALTAVLASSRSLNPSTTSMGRLTLGRYSGMPSLRRASTLLPIVPSMAGFLLIHAFER